MKIDVSGIKGYAEMTPEQKIAALEALEIEVPKKDETDYQKLKDSVQRANAEAADYKRQLREKQTEAERAEAERAERDKQIQEELNRYRTNERVSTYQTRLMSVGYDENTAKEMAKTLPEGIGDEFFAAHKAFMDTKFQAMEAAALNKQPGLSVGQPPKAKTVEEEIAAQAAKYAGL